MRKKAVLACVQCNSRNYTTMKNSQTSPARMEVKKYCKYCDVHTVHRETK
ncbi:MULTISPECIES: 50S ribosomal protein L33 [Bacillales]|nr:MULTISPECIES: 50S ribosomal protein L33 [Bacillaceae]MBF0707172.1 50S ribosomal protein L33 [Pseudalkalibacillus hwajinpoensis]MDO6658424.1 50S ribosomal protein L33 [Anaerobacillus sp. 1_MG-2023]